MHATWNLEILIELPMPEKVGYFSLEYYAEG